VHAHGIRSHLAFALLISATLALSACGQTPGCRALTGAGVGAAGGATGALTSPNVINGPSPCY